MIGPEIVDVGDGLFRIEFDGFGVAYDLTEAEAEAWIDGWAYAQGGDGWLRSTAKEWSR